MVRLASQIKDANPDNFPITLLCSTAPRAEQGGKIIMQELEIPWGKVFFDECFWNDNFHRGDLDKAIKLIEEHLQEKSFVVVISHLGYESRLTIHAAGIIGLRLPYVPSVEYGEGLLVSDTLSRPQRIS